MKSLYTYLDYRRYLADFYEEKKKTTRHFSYRYFSGKAGIKSPVFLKLVIDGKRNLSEAMIAKFAKALGLSRRQAHFFRNLVQFNQVKTADQKQEHYRVVRSMQNLVPEHTIDLDKYDYFAQWYTPVVRELVCLHDFGDDWEAVATCVIPRITSAQARKSVDLLVRLGLIARTKEGGYRQKHSALTTDSQVMSLVLRSFNKTMVEKAAAAIDTMAVSERFASGQTLGVSQACYEAIIQEVKAFQERIATMVHHDRGSSRVCQLNVQLFPVTQDTVSMSDEEGGLA